MELFPSTRHFSWLIVLILACAALLPLLGPATPTADAATPCTRYGETAASKLRKSEARASIRCFINRERSQRGLAKLDRDKRLQRAAQTHTNVMDTQNCFAHQCPGEGSLQTRLRNVGYLLSGLLRWSYGETIAWGPGSRSTPKAMVKAWMGSSLHRAAILSSLFRDVGVGFVRGRPDGSGGNGGIYTADFGLRLL